MNTTAKFTREDFTQNLAGQAHTYTSYWHDATTPGARELVLSLTNDDVYNALATYAYHLRNKDPKDVSDYFLRFANEFHTATMNEFHAALMKDCANLGGDYMAVDYDANLMDCAVQFYIFGRQMYA